MASFQSFFLPISPSSVSIYICLHTLRNVGTEVAADSLVVSNKCETQNLRVMANLQRSAKSFRRQGSSGLVWDDSLLSDQFYGGAKNDKSDLKELRPCQSAKAIFVGMDFSSSPNDAAPPPTCPRSLSSLGMDPSQRAYARSLSGVLSKPYLVKKLKMGKTTDP